MCPFFGRHREPFTRTLSIQNECHLGWHTWMLFNTVFLFEGEIVSKNKIYIEIKWDEIQRLPSWERWKSSALHDQYEWTYLQGQGLYQSTGRKENCKATATTPGNLLWFWRAGVVYNPLFLNQKHLVLYTILGWIHENTLYICVYIYT